MKRSLFLSSALAFIIIGAGVAPAMAQTESRQEMRRIDRMAARLNLTEAQKTQIEQIFQSSRSRMMRVLTSEQRQQLQTARQQEMRGRKLFASLNLSQEQKQQMKTIRQNTREQIGRILTAEQRRNLEQMRQNRRQNTQR